MDVHGFNDPVKHECKEMFVSVLVLYHVHRFVVQTAGGLGMKKNSSL